MTSWRPHRKVAAAGTLGPALAAFLVWALPDMPQPVVGLIAAGVPVVVAYLTREQAATRPPGSPGQ